MSGGNVYVRSVTRADFEEALKLTQPSTQKADEYRLKVGRSGGTGHEYSCAIISPLTYAYPRTIRATDPILRETCSASS